MGTLGCAVHLNEPGLEVMLPGSPQPPESWQCQPVDKPAHQLAFLEKVTAPAAPSGGRAPPGPSWSLGPLCCRAASPTGTASHQALVSPACEANRNRGCLENYPAENNLPNRS